MKQIKLKFKIAPENFHDKYTIILYCIEKLLPQSNCLETQRIISFFLNLRNNGYIPIAFTVFASWWSERMDVF